MLKHDSNYGTYEHEVGHDDAGIIVDGKHIKVLAEKDPSVLPWGDLGVELVIESTGFFTAKEDAEKHIVGGGAKRVIISGPSKSDGVDTIVLVPTTTKSRVQRMSLATPAVQPTAWCCYGDP